MNDADSTLLLVDIGNSRVKWGIASNAPDFGSTQSAIAGVSDRLSGQQSEPVLDRVDSHLSAVDFCQIKIGEPFPTQTISSDKILSSMWGEIPSPLQVMVSNVAGLDIANQLKAWVQQRWGLVPQFACSMVKGYGVNNAYRYPEKLGVDRWVALIAAHHACPGPVCVVDCGTAITVDALDAEGNHLGGVIAPGLMVMRQSLAGGTHALPNAEDNFHHTLAIETKAAIASGTLQAVAGLIERCIREITSRLGSKPRLWVTGGDAPAIAPLLEIPFELKPELVLEGLLVIACKPSLIL
jgi:type III pantothenate kinase